MGDKRKRRKDKRRKGVIRTVKMSQEYNITDGGVVTGEQECSETGGVTKRNIDHLGFVGWQPCYSLDSLTMTSRNISLPNSK